MSTLRIFLLSVFFTAPLCAQVDVAGRIVDGVVCEDDESQSYALYVPANYSREQKWPVIFCFDARARGRIPVERLQPAAERYGYIVAGSLNSRNGPWPANAAAIAAMVKDVSAHLSIDPARIYACGVSGGARVATAVALSGTAKGVIACSGGFPPPGQIPDKIDFFYFGTAGVDDCNFTEMSRLDAELTSRSAAHRLVVFEGGHEWAPSAVLTEAVEWLELQSMRTGVKAKNVAFIGTLFERRRDALSTLRGVARWRSLRSLKDDFESLVETAPFAAEYVELGASPEVKAELKQEEESTRREEGMFTLLEKTVHGTEQQKRELADELRSKAGATDDSVERRLVRRVLGGFALMARARVQSAFAQGDYAQAAAFLELAAALDPTRTDIQQDLARAKSLRSGLAAAEHSAADDDVVRLPELRVAAVLSSVELRLFHLPNVTTDIGSRGTAPLSFLSVEAVRDGSTAARAGIKLGMQVTAIQGLRIRGLTEERLYAAMNQPARGEIVVTVRDFERGKERDIRIEVGQRPERERWTRGPGDREILGPRFAPPGHLPDTTDTDF